MILHIQAQKDAVLRRAAERGKETGRMVPREILESSMEAVPRSVEALAPYVDVAIRVLNLSNQDPKLQREPTAVNPPADIPITFEYIKKLWMPIDTDGDGQLTVTEVAAAIAQGILTQEVVDTIDIDGDGAISKEELALAVQKCDTAGRKKYRNTTQSFPIRFFSQQGSKTTSLDSEPQRTTSKQSAEGLLCSLVSETTKIMPRNADAYRTWLIFRYS